MERIAKRQIHVNYQSMPASRIERMRQLSTDHRLALELVARIREEFQLGACSEALFSMVADEFALQLEKHFEIEEGSLACTFALEVDSKLAERTLNEHAKLRALVVDIRQRDIAALKAFAELLEAHVHFEERDLYPTIKASISLTD